MSNGYKELKKKYEGLTDDQIKAIQAVNDFIFWKVPGYNVELIHAIEDAKDAAEVRALLRKARAAS